MSQVLIVVESLSDWAAYYPSEHVISAADYLADSQFQLTDKRVRVINLCHDFHYLGTGYYVSLLAEARGQRVLPSVATINDLAERKLYRAALSGLEQALDRNRHAGGNDIDHLATLVCFGEAATPELDDIARAVFEQLPAPLLRLQFRKRKRWLLEKVHPVSMTELDDAEQDRFANALDKFSTRIWRKPTRKQRYRYDLAILIEPGEALPPSNRGALRKMTQIGRRMGLDIALITRRDYLRLAEFDALFIRTTTALNHYSHYFARKAQQEGLVVIDDPDSILRCTNKVYLAECLQNAGIATPPTHILLRDKPDTITNTVRDGQFPMVLKIPDGAFSRGMRKVENAAALAEAAEPYFAQSGVVLAQEFYYTDFDWRIGVLDGRPLFACRYYMSRGHWQIYEHRANGKVESGNSETIPITDVPKKVLRTALKAAKLMGDGLYGVDLKQRGNEVVIMEVNDNPNIDLGIEDKSSGDELYRRLFEVFIHRLELRSAGY